jgi:hypothetical protein
VGRFIRVLLCSAVLATGAIAQEPSADDLVKRLLTSDPWGFSGAEISARLRLVDKAGAKSELVFSGKSRQYDPPFSKSLVRFSAPADLAGAAFLQIQKRDGDDERFLFLPELKRSRRISGNMRSGSFMGTDFSFADLDRRDFRDSVVKVKGKEPIGKWPCTVVDMVPKTKDSEYSHIEIWIREENALPLRMKMYDRGGTLLKTFEALETKRVQGTWFISKSRMTNNQQKHATELHLEQIAVKTDLPDDEFTVRALEKP